jgi:UrcA family protein
VRTAFRGLACVLVTMTVDFSPERPRASFGGQHPPIAEPKTKPHNRGILKMKIRSCNRSTLWMATAIAAACMTSFAADATEPASTDEVLKKVVNYGDLNLDRPEGIAALYRRVSNAAARVCAPFESRELSQLSAWRTCVNGSISRAVAKINLASLTAYADDRNGHSPGIFIAAKN